MAQTSARPCCDRLELLVTGDAPRSHRARANLAEVTTQLGLTDMPVVEIDVLHDPAVAVKYRVFATPALACVNNEQPADVLYSDLSDWDAVLKFLRRRAA